MTETDVASEPTGPINVDPFDFHGHPASVIAGLGGDLPLPEPTYAFHSSYVPVARGHAHFSIKFDRLKAKRGTLWLRIHMLPSGSGAAARMVTSQRVQLNWLAQNGGELHMRFEAFRGATYAIMGLVPDESDASADHLTITLDRPATRADLEEGATIAEAQTTAYTSDTIKGVSLLLSTEQPVFAEPVCQPCTTAQLRERVFRSWGKRLESSGNDAAATWQTAYVMQVLERYGLLQARARGLAFGEESARIAGFLKANGVECDSVRLSEADDDVGRDDTIHPSTLPGKFFAYDLLLSTRATDTFTNEQSAQAFLESAMECLRPGGLAVHVVAHRLAGRGARPVSFDRNGLEKVVLAMISRGHQVARFKPVLQHTKVEKTDDGFVPFGIIARRAASIL